MERSSKREKEDYKLEDGRHRSTKMWYCRLYGIMMLQHLDAWEMPSAEAFQESLLGLHWNQPHCYVKSTILLLPELFPHDFYNAFHILFCIFNITWQAKPSVKNIFTYAYPIL